MMSTDVDWTNNKHVSVTSLLEVIETQVLDKKDKGFSVITSDKSNGLQAKDRPVSENTKNERNKLRTFCDSDNILLSVYELETRRKREQAAKLQELNSVPCNTPESCSNWSNRERSSPKKLHVSVNIPYGGGEVESKSTSASSKKSVTKLQMSHRSPEDAIKNIANSSKMSSLIHTVPTGDTIDIVVAANDPDQRFKPGSPPLIKIASANSSRKRERYSKLSSSAIVSTNSKILSSDEDRPQSTYPSFPMSINHAEDKEVSRIIEKEPEVTLISGPGHSGGRRSRMNKSKASYHYSVDPNMNRNAYNKALWDARNKYFKHVPLDKAMTRPFEFSYFNLVNRGGSADAVRERRMKKPYGMKRIFGEIKPDDYYPVSKTRSEQ